MSSDLLEFLDKDEHGNIVGLDMKASGYAFLYISGEKDNVDYALSPDKQGIKNANNIISGLQNWIDHTIEINK